MLPPAKPNNLFLPIRFHPLYFFTLASIAGIIATHYTYPSYYLLYSVGMITIAAFIGSFFFYGKAYRFYPKHLICLLLAVVGFTLGCWRTNQHYAYYSDDSWLPAGSVTVRGRITDCHNLDNKMIKQSVTVQLTGIKRESDKEYTPANRIVTWQNTRKLPVAVDDVIVLMDVTLKKPVKKDFAWYLMKEGIEATIFTHKPHYELTERRCFSIRRWISQKRTSLFERLQKKISPSTYALFSSLFLGNRTAIKKDLTPFAEKFRWWGISHHLARSGFHLIIFCLLWDKLLHYFPIPLAVKQLFLMLLAFFYYVLSWSNISFIRSFLSFIVYRCGTMWLAPVHITYTLALIAFLLLMRTPSQLLFLDFQLSFLLTFALAWFNQQYTPYRLPVTLQTVD